MGCSSSKAAVRPGPVAQVRAVAPTDGYDNDDIASMHHRVSGHGSSGSNKVLTVGSQSQPGADSTTANTTEPRVSTDQPTEPARRGFDRQSSVSVQSQGGFDRQSSVSLSETLGLVPEHGPPPQSQRSSLALPSRNGASSQRQSFVSGQGSTESLQTTRSSQKSSWGNGTWAMLKKKLSLETKKPGLRLSHVMPRYRQSLYETAKGAHTCTYARVAVLVCVCVCVCVCMCARLRWHGHGGGYVTLCVAGHAMP